ncbi:MAG: hypothetical protein ACBR20_24540 [Microcoleus sp.]
MKLITFAQSFKRAYKSLIRKHPELQPKVEAKEAMGEDCRKVRVRRCDRIWRSRKKVIK